MSMNKFKGIIWFVLVLAFIAAKFFLSTNETVESIVAAGVFYFLLIGYFIIPFLLSSDIRIPVHGHILRKGENDIMRIVVFIVASYYCYNILAHKI